MRIGAEIRLQRTAKQKTERAASQIRHISGEYGD
jgi:hypothetical protein